MHKKGFLVDISILRSLSIIVVVFFHVYGMMFADHFPATKELYHSTYFTFNNCWIINVAMPTFVFISGYLFYYQLEKGKYPTFIFLLKKKFTRILIPYFIFGLIMMATTGNFHPFELLHGGYWHLWFLPMIFWCFIIGYFLKGIGNWNKWIIFALIIAIFSISLAGKFLPRIMGLHNVTIWFGWFLLGEVVYLFKEEINAAIRKMKIYWILLFLYIIINLFKPVPYGKLTWYLILSQVFIVLALWYYFHNINDRIKKLLQPLISFSRYSYGIYIFHNWLALYLISHTAQRLLPLADWASNHIILFPFCFFLVTMGISFLLSWSLLKTKIGKFLIG